MHYCMGTTKVVGQRREPAVHQIIMPELPEVEILARHLRPRAHDSTGGRQNVVYKVRRRLDLLQRPQPLLPRLHVREQRTANPANAPVSLEALLARGAQPAFEGVAEERFKFGALDPVFYFIWHSHHLPIGTLQEASKFRSSPVNSRFDGSLRNPQSRGDFPIIHVL